MNDSLEKILEGKVLLVPKEHPILPIPTKENLKGLVNKLGVDPAVEKWNEIVAAREEVISQSLADPLNFGFDLDLWGCVNACMDGDFFDDPKKYFFDKWHVDIDGFKPLRRPFNEFWLFGGNRSGKSEGSAKRVVHDALRFKRAIIWCFHSDLQSSIQQQQELIWKYLPGSIKNLNNKRDRKGIYSISYTIKNGFADNKLVLPNGSQIIFRYYTQDISILEGAELGDPERGRCIGYWADELIPVDWVVTLRLRTATRGSIGLVTFTPVDGYTPAVAEVRMGERVLVRQGAPLLPEKYKEAEISLLGSHAEEWCEKKGYVYLSSSENSSRVNIPVEWELLPRISVSSNGNALMFYFWSEENPFGNYEEIKRQLRGKDKSFVKIRAYGLAEKQAAAKFPLFNRKVHVVKHSMIPNSGVTRWMFCDPAGARNWFMLWGCVDRDERLWIYREFPDCDDEVPGFGVMGEWAKPGVDHKNGARFDGLKGPGQVYRGWSLLDYKEEVARLEKWRDYGSDLPRIEWSDITSAEEIYERRVDSRPSSSNVIGIENQRTLGELLIEIGLPMKPTFKESVSSRNTIDEGVMMINDALNYDKNSEIGVGNGPKLFISERCKNLIFALENWTGRDGNKGATKDPIDLLRYMYLGGVYYYDRSVEDKVSQRNSQGCGY